MTHRRILVVGRPKSGKLSLLKALTNTVPTNTDDSHAGLSHTLTINTPYYKADIPIWIDEITDPASEWASNYCEKEAKEVLQVLGAFVFVFKRPNEEKDLEIIRQDLKQVSRVVKACGSLWDGICLSVAMSNAIQPQIQKSHDDWEDLCQDFQFEYLDAEAKGRNDYGEPVGIERLREAMETNEWTLDPFGGMHDELGEDDDDEDGGLKLEADELEKEMSSLHFSIQDDDDHDNNKVDKDEIQVEKLESAMMKLQAIRDMAGELPEAERKKLAARTVSDIMKTI